MVRTAALFTLAAAMSFFFIMHRLVYALTLSPSINVTVGAIVGGLPLPNVGGVLGGLGQTGVQFSGFAYPHAVVNVQNGTTLAATTTADANGLFSVVVPKQSSDLYTLFAVDTAGRRSTLINFPTNFYDGHLTDISHIRFAPTITTDKLAVAKGSYITITGAALPAAGLVISIDGDGHATYTLSADAQGVYSITIPLTLPVGSYTISTAYQGDTTKSMLVRVIIGDHDMYQNEVTNNVPGDCNVDQKVTITDFSVMAYWFGKKNPPRCVDLNHDGQVTLVDFSILAFYWSE